MIPIGTDVHVAIDGKVISILPRLFDGREGYLYQIKGTDGRIRWVPDYNVREYRQSQGPGEMFHVDDLCNRRCPAWNPEGYDEEAHNG